ncbi:enoyl-CoA-hydratase DpgB [Nocardia iowensis]|uniref:Enoyl-CoA hydratase/isomerase family protein n=1 Tax=Nocardia iowensis TaxID=204891 RepID=A0ABX8RXK3_NOCIO|nr:enoyl-CoA-hydratase DpgB [Nocardia iowensis]QXN94372.1 enoyl-CoA hydratase/isomerase family protein [Nocardia iowensis]
MTVNPREQELETITTAVAANTGLSPDLTMSVAAAAMAAEDASAAPGTCVVLHIVGPPAGHRFDWPGRVTVGDVNKWEGALRRLEQVPAPIVAIVDGDAYGPAAELLLVADYRIMRARTTFSFASSDAGVWPAMAVYRLAVQVGVGRARELAVQGGALSAEAARACGVIDAVAEPGTEADAVATGLAIFESSVGSEIAIRRRLVLDAATTRFEDALGAHLAASDRTLRRERTAS